MKVCYIVYREDNVMVFDSQVLEYLQRLKEFPEVEEVTLVLFRHEDHLFKRFFASWITASRSLLCLCLQWRS